MIFEKTARVGLDEESCFVSIKLCLSRKSILREIEISGVGVELNYVREGVLVVADTWRQVMRRIEMEKKNYNCLDEEMGRKT